MSQLVNVLIGLVLAVVIYLVGTAYVTFRADHLVWGLIAVVVFLAFAFGRIRTRVP